MEELASSSALLLLEDAVSHQKQIVMHSHAKSKIIA